MAMPPLRGTHKKINDYHGPHTYQESPRSEFEVYILFTSVYTALLPTEELMSNALHRLPVMEKAEIRSMINGPESFTPDGRYLLGEVPEVSYKAIGQRYLRILWFCGVVVSTRGGSSFSETNYSELSM